MDLESLLPMPAPPAGPSESLPPLLEDPAARLVVRQQQYRTREFSHPQPSSWDCQPSARGSDVGVDRKRARDRKAQQNLRQKRNAYVQQLEAQVKFLESSTDDQVAELEDLVLKLHVENQRLTAQKNRLSDALAEMREENVHENLAGAVGRILAKRNALRVPSPAGALETRHDGQVPPNLPPDDAVHEDGDVWALGMDSTNHYSNWLNPQSLDDGEALVQCLSPEKPGIDIALMSDINQNAKNGFNHQTHIPTSQQFIEVSGSEVSRVYLSENIVAEANDIWQAQQPARTATSYLDFFDFRSPGRCGDMSSTLAQGPASSISGANLPTATTDNRNGLMCSIFLPEIWLRVPVDVNIPYSDHDLVATYLSQVSREDIENCPDVPDALNLLYGGGTNVLANNISKALADYVQREADRLGIGYLLYVYLKWRFNPTLKRYLYIPEFLRPTEGQLSHPHPAVYDKLLWPQIRWNLIKAGTKLTVGSVREVIRSFSCALRVRWGNGPVLQTDARGVMIRDEFFNVIMREDGWGLKPSFVERYPEFSEGLELQKILYHDI